MRRASPDISRASSRLAVLLLLGAGPLLVLYATAGGQGLGADQLNQILDTKGQVELKMSGVVVKVYDYDAADSERIEAVAFRPAAAGRYPALLLIPGYSRSARDYLPLGVRLAKEGFACLSVSQPGFGKSTGNPDFVGPRTIAALETGLHRYLSEGYVDSTRVGLFGYSRGAMAASLLAVREKGLRAAVLGGGIYDLKKAYTEIEDPGIRGDIEKEAGLSEAALRERSSIFEMSNLACPVLILHGAKDRNAPVAQAQLLRARLDELKKPYEIKIFPDQDHNIGMQNLLDAMIPFLKKNLLAQGAGH